jgi:glycyl-tRNA synthetase beta subunit
LSVRKGVEEEVCFKQMCEAVRGFRVAQEKKDGEVVLFRPSKLIFVRRLLFLAALLEGEVLDLGSGGVPSQKVMEAGRFLRSQGQKRRELYTAGEAESSTSTELDVDEPDRALIT